MLMHYLRPKEKVMAQNGTVAYVTQLPKCDIHTDHEAQYDASIRINGRRTWANICEELFKDPTLGASLGTGRGQKLEVRK
jgi:hypothetical protein